MPPRKTSSPKNGSTANLGFEAKLWLAADKLRNNMDAAVPSAATPVPQAKAYKHVVLGLIFLKYISDSFEEHRSKLLAGEGDYAGADPEDADEYRAENVFWAPPEARWSHLQARAKRPSIGKDVDDAIELPRPPQPIQPTSRGVHRLVIDHILANPYESPSTLSDAQFPKRLSWTLPSRLADVE